MPYKRFLRSRYETDETIRVIGNASKSSMGPSIDLLVWNVFKAKKKNWEDDFALLSKNMDLILLQEAIVKLGHSNDFYDLEKLEWIMASSFKDKISNFYTGVKTGSTAKSCLCQLLASEQGEPIYNTKKMSLTTEYVLAEQKKTLQVINMHAINFVSFKKYALHLEQIFNIVRAHKGPLILAGDFNTWSKRRWFHFVEMTYHLKLREVPLDRRPRFSHLGQHLDHIFFRGLELQGAEVLTHIQSSDHFPITARFRLDNNAPN